jgi:hypothetical protein
VGHGNHKEISFPNFVSDFNATPDHFTDTPDQIRWKVFPFPKEDDKVDFLSGMFTYCGTGSPSLKVTLLTIGRYCYLYVLM